MADVTSLGGKAAQFTAVDIITITPQDNVDLVRPIRAIRCKPAAGTAGTIRIKTHGGAIRNTEIAQGEVLTVYATQIHASGTTATGLEGLV